jgi:hypothetical protein
MLDRRFVVTGLKHHAIPKAAIHNTVRAGYCPLPEELEVSFLEKVAEGRIRDEPR